MVELNILGEGRIDKNKRIILGKGVCKECGGETRITAPFVIPTHRTYFFAKRHQCLGACKKLWLFNEDMVYLDNLPML